MNLGEIGQAIRQLRLGRGLTQGQLAAAADITRTTLNQLENGLLKDLGIRKVQALLDQVGLILEVRDASAEPRAADFLRLASITASVSFKQALTEQELLHAILTGKVPAGRRPHLRKLLEEGPRPLLVGLVHQLNGRAPPGKVEKNLDKIAATVGIEEIAGRWWKKSG